MKLSFEKGIDVETCILNDNLWNDLVEYQMGEGNPEVLPLNELYPNNGGYAICAVPKDPEFRKVGHFELDYIVDDKAYNTYKANTGSYLVKDKDNNFYFADEVQQQPLEQE